jgi:preprotein translocase subunit SecA
LASIINKLLRAGEGRVLNRLRNYTAAVNALEDSFKALSDEDLKNETAILRERYSAGESLAHTMFKSWVVQLFTSATSPK